MTNYALEIVSEPLILGEGPHWDEQTQRLYFVDIPAAEVHCYDPIIKKHTKASVGNGEKTVSLIIPIKDKLNEFLISYGNDIAQITWDGISSHINDLKVVSCNGEAYPETRINDGKCNPNGVLYAGTMELEPNMRKEEKGYCALYYFDGKNQNPIMTNVKLSNGLAWSVDGTKFFYIDSLRNNLKKYEYDANTHTLTNEQILFDLKNKNIQGFLDGMTIDTDGNLWVAVFEGKCVLKINSSTGDLMQTIEIPAERVTSVVFGGSNLSDLYVTSAGDSKDDLANPSFRNNKLEPPKGCVFKVHNIGVKGYPSVPVKF